MYGTYPWERGLGGSGSVDCEAEKSSGTGGNEELAESRRCGNGMNVRGPNGEHVILLVGLDHHEQGKRRYQTGRRNQHVCRLESSMG